VPIRTQLSLFVPPPIRDDIEAVRRITDPTQHRLIPAHVTLCREHELGGIGLAVLQARFGDASQGPIMLQFGAPERFGGHGILLPCIGGTAEFQALRAVALDTGQPGPQAPHLTLAHPRNPRAPRNDLQRAATLRHGLRITFAEVHLIEQVDDAPWVVRGTVPLLEHAGGAA
jgi:2'-5' RNA ligase